MGDMRSGDRRLLLVRSLVWLARSSAAQWRRRVISRGIDVTDILSARRTLVLAPHPDDETLGVGATIAHCRAAGVPVTVVIASDGRHSSASSLLTPGELAAIRTTEVRAACRALGVAEADLVELGFEDGTLEANCSVLTRRLRRIVLECRPGQILVPSVHDDHPDHRGLHRALLRAMADGPPTGCDILAYPVWAWAQGPWFIEVAARERLEPMLWALRWAFGRSRPLVVRTDGVLDVKREALQAYATQITNYTGEPTWRWLRPEFCDLFTMPAEVLLPVRARRSPAAVPAAVGAAVAAADRPEGCELEKGAGE
jgi:LmbE family N-acetylglucosaminyl deacetylase